MRVTIYWRTKDGGLISAGITINGETVAEVDDRQLDELKEYERQGFIRLRNKQ